MNYPITFFEKYDKYISDYLYNSFHHLISFQHVNLLLYNVFHLHQIYLSKKSDVLLFRHNTIGK